VFRDGARDVFVNGVYRDGVPNHFFPFHLNAYDDGRDGCCDNDDAFSFQNVFRLVREVSFLNFSSVNEVCETRLSYML